jgi:hypothetical protein
MQSAFCGFPFVPQTAPAILIREGNTVLAPIQFLWNATRGHRLTPWSSKYLRWRVETYSGQKAENLTAQSVLGFMWNSRWELLGYLIWIARLDREVRRRV